VLEDLKHYQQQTKKPHFPHLQSWIAGRPEYFCLQPLGWHP
jgi:hypothetical protein